MKKLIFVYNAKGGLWNGALDSAHKILSPNTYDCQLCSVTFGTFGMKKEWSNYLDSLREDGITIDFLHKDEKDSIGIELKKLPMVLLEDGQKINLLVKADELNAASTIEAMIALINEKMDSFNA